MEVGAQGAHLRTQYLAMVTWPTVPRLTCKKNQIDYDCRAYPSPVGHVNNFAQDELENDVLPILDADGHMTNCTENNLQKELNWLTAGPIQVQLVMWSTLPRMTLKMMSCLS